MSMNGKKILHQASLCFSGVTAKMAACLALPLIALAGCASPSPFQSSTQGITVVRVGQITSIRDIAVANTSSNAGAIVGGLVGGILGSSIGNGSGQVASAIGGTVAGGFAGNQIGKSASTNKLMELTVKFSEGDTQAYQIAANDTFHVGDTVKLLQSNKEIRISH